MKKTVVTISREFGSGGRLIGEKLAADLGLLFCDRSLIQLTAEKSGLSPAFVERNEESVPNSFLFNITASAYASFKTTLQYDTPINDKTFFAQSSIIRDIAEKDSCVIVGRCADYILRDNPALVRVFVCAPYEERKKRAVEKYGMTPEEVDSRIKKIDKARSNYYKFYTGEVWGNIHNHDLIINTGFTGIDGAVALIKLLLNDR